MARTSLSSSILSVLFLSALVEAGLALPAAAVGAVALALASHAAWWTVGHELAVRNLRGRAGSPDRFTTVSES
ncbi:MAG TPA: hypothetical protein VFJ80_11835 [Candidatus Limnocylindrales bacterium]|jgi:hypothetical protein|nr:hypothetical protein [Candidatus Limnocylindrales bacterium]